jgi:hypothetical protein
MQRKARVLLPAATVLFALVFVFSGCGRKPIPANKGIAGKNVVVILSSDKRFKQEVVTRVAASLEGKNIRVVLDNIDAADAYRAADYGAVVYFTEFWMWHTPSDAKRYFHRNGDASNIVFMVTSGNPHVKIKKPFDAVTSASSQKQVDRVANEIIARLDAILGK